LHVYYTKDEADKMPRHAADLEEALKKKGGLTLSQLANYDDLITDALVDRVCISSARKRATAGTNSAITGILLVYHS